MHCFKRPALCKVYAVGCVDSLGARPALGMIIAPGPTPGSSFVEILEGEGRPRKFVCLTEYLSPVDDEFLARVNIIDKKLTTKGV